MGFYYHITLVNVDNPVERYWDSSDVLSSLQLMTDGREESSFNPSVDASSPDTMTMDDFTRKYFNPDTWAPRLPTDDIELDDDHGDDVNAADQSWASSFVKRKTEDISGAPSSSKQFCTTTTGEVLTMANQTNENIHGK